MENEQFDPRTSLQQIELMIGKARNQLHENGHLYRLWGWVVLVCALFQFAATRFSLMDKPYTVWWLTSLVLVYQVYYIAKGAKKRQVTTYADRMLAAIWIVFCAMGALTMVVLLSKSYQAAIYPLLLMLYGMPTILSGVLLKIKPLLWGGLCCFIFCVIALFVPYLYQLLLLALAVVVAWILPGYFIKQQYAKQHALSR